MAPVTECKPIFRPAAPGPGPGRAGPMERECRRGGSSHRWLAPLDRLARWWGDFRSREAQAAFKQVIGQRGPEEVCLSVGGGPLRVHPRLLNMNLGLFPNVDLVGTAYALPLADDSVDAIYCEAVLEHLERPEAAVREMFRALKPGGELFAATAFLQSFHAYPDHFQNFTLEGHNRLFRQAGFEIVNAGACVGPTFALTDLAAQYCRHYLPGRILSRGVQKLVVLGSLLVRPLDRLLLRKPGAHLLASSVYAHLVKPRADTPRNEEGRR
ncbi:MAG: methyltransferase domain-containing protein [Acidobacteriota bacterium]